MKPRKHCNHAGCKILIPYNETYCGKHQRKYSSAYDSYENRKEKGGKYFWFYKSKEWRKTSELYRINNPCCEDCLEEGIIKKADVVDHMVEIRDDWDRRLDESNLRSLCHLHHNSKTRAMKAERSTKKTHP